MKTKILFISIISILLVQCKKDNIHLEEQSIINTENSYQLVPELKEKIKSENGLLVFESKEHFTRITNLLNTEIKNYISEFFQNKKELNDEEIDSCILADSFNPYAVLHLFENQQSFKSLRTQLQEKDLQRLQNTELNSEENPLFYPLSERCQNIANINGEYMIGTTIYRIEEDGVVYEILNSDFNALDEIRKGNSCLKSNNPNVIVHNYEIRNDLKAIETSCVAYRRKTGNFPNLPSGYKIDCAIDLDWDGWGSAAKAKASAYRSHKILGKTIWTQWWTYMDVTITVLDYDIDCNYQGSYWWRDSGNGYWITARVGQSGVGFRVKTGEKGGAFQKTGYPAYF